MDSRPNSFVIGAPKCATTSLVEALATHSRVYVPFIKEPGYFGSDFGSDVGDEEEYLELYTKAPAQATVLVDGTTHYLASADAVSQILHFNPQARFICAFRDPLEVAPAFHSQLRRHHIEPLSSFDAAWADQPERRKRMRAGGSREPLYDEICLFGKQLERLYTRVPEDRVFVVFFDELITKPEVTLDRVQAFLGLDRENLQLPNSNVNQEVVLENMHRFKMHLARHARRLKRLLGIHRNMDLFRRAFAFTTKPSDRDKPDQATIESMKQSFSADMDLFESVAGRSIRGSAWDQEPAGTSGAP
ncbi:sulfotransferase [Salinisphaera sp. PC39]|uniref:sulfotransferase family protein n=1 Tax=Salinisphaera sp. PC39 TaxID=1304156 RepID=UPI00333FFA82